MKKIFVMCVALCASVAFAGVQAKHITNKNGTFGGFVGDDAVFIYTDKDKIAKIKDDVKLKIAGAILRDKVCSAANLKKMIDRYGVKVTYIYLSQDLKDAAVITIDSCKDLKARK